MQFFIIIQTIFFGIGCFFCFLNKLNFIFKKQSLNMKSSLCFPEDDDNNKHNSINKFLQDINIEVEPKYSYDLDLEKPLYTLIWFPCPECDELIKLMKILNLKYIFINIDLPESHYLFPLLYKEDICIGDTLFDIYEVIYF